MALAPCGCEKARDALLSADDDVRRTAGDAAGPLQAAWRCPAAGFDPARDRAELPPRQRAVLAAVDALCEGEDCGTTCPKAVARDPVAQGVLAARVAREHGQTREYVGWPSAALCDAIALVDRGYADRLAWEQKHPEKKPDGGR